VAFNGNQTGFYFERTPVRGFRLQPDGSRTILGPIRLKADATYD